MHKVLIIDDDDELCGLLSQFLGGEGFEVQSVPDGHSGLALAERGEHDLVILDVMLPDLSGMDVLRRIRTTSEVPVLMLTARGDDLDRILGLELGADDYLPKPFLPRELVARLRAVLRRFGAGKDRAAQGRRLVLDDLELDCGSRQIRRQGDVLSLTSAEFDILHLLMKTAGTVVGRDRITETALGRELSSFDRSLDVHISNLRRKLGPGQDGYDRIKTVRGVGYMYVRRAGSA